MAQFTMTEVAQRLGISRQRVHQFITDGRLKAKRIGSILVIDERSLDVFIRENPRFAYQSARKGK